MTTEIVHHHIEPDGCGIAGSELMEDFQEVGGRLTFMNFAHETFSVDVIKGQELLRALQPAVSGAETLGMAATLPGAPVERPQLQRTTLVEADYGPSLRRSVVEVEDTVFLSSNCGSGDSFQVFECWKETPSRRSRRLTHSSVIGGRRSCSRQYAFSFFTDQTLKGRPSSSGRARAVLIRPRTCSPVTTGSGPRGLFGRSKLTRPPSLKRCNQ